jgi:hypothetical protein
MKQPLYRQGNGLCARQDTCLAGELGARKDTMIMACGATIHTHRQLAGTILEAPDEWWYLAIARTTQVVREDPHPPRLRESLPGRPGLSRRVRD